MAEKVVENGSENLEFVPDYLKTQQKCNEIKRTMPRAFHHIPDHFKTQEMCIKAAEADPSFLQIVPDHFKMQGICYKAMKENLRLLVYVPDWFVTQQQAKLWNNDNKLIEWYHGYQK